MECGGCGMQGEHEASRRMKTELLIQMDGIARTSELVFVLAATNMPWELDQAMLRRLEKRVFVDVPCAAARRSILQGCLADKVDAGVDLDALAARLEGYSGSDLVLVAKEAAMRPLRQLLRVLDDEGGGACDGAGRLESVVHADLDAAVSCVKATAHMHTDKYKHFALSFGSA
jgi:katanin p60 ATPase-containing subunit A1